MSWFLDPVHQSLKKTNNILNDKISLECDPGNLTAAIGDGGNDVSMLQVTLDIVEYKNFQTVCYFTLSVFRRPI